MELNTNYNKMSQKDAEHQREWNEWMTKYFDENGVFDEKREKEDRKKKEQKEKEALSVLKKITERKESYQKETITKNTKVLGE